jgi:inhibitor of KinA sporulation pathway (predicted exonuclease)
MMGFPVFSPMQPQPLLREMRLSPPPPNAPISCYYDYLVVVDFEATCEDNKNQTVEVRPLKTHERPEIIQFPAVLINVRNQSVVDTFNTYVKPVERPKLSAFCTELTGITQVRQVDWIV